MADTTPTPDAELSDDQLATAGGGTDTQCHDPNAGQPKTLAEMIEDMLKPPTL